MLTSVVAQGIFFGEGPRWHDGRLWFSDFFAHAVTSFDPVTGDLHTELVLPGEGRPSGLGWLPDGRLLVVSMLDRRVLRREFDGTLVVHADLADVATFHTNDMVVDASGRAYVGNFGFDLDRVVREDPASLRSAPTATLALVDPDGTVRAAATDLAFPNGAVLTPDGTSLVVAESMAARLTAFDVAGDGSLSNRRVVAATPGCVPDGICLDAEGALWVANAVAPEVRRYGPDGTLLATVTTSQPAFACMLGAGPRGGSRTTLYVCTAPASAAHQAAQAPLGLLEAVEVGVEGAGLP